MADNLMTSEIIFDYICGYIDQHGYPPTIRNIAQACQLGVTTVFYNLNKLESWGWIIRETRIARSLRVLRHTKSQASKNLEQN